jgi:hypothetical protein
MDEEVLDIEERIRRCHRLASVMTDDKVRVALERLAREYEQQLPEHRRRPRRPFMLDPDRRA